MPKDIVV